MYPDEFVGIRLLINSSPDLETLSFHMVPHRSHDMVAPLFDQDTYWSYDITHKCLNKTLKFLEFWNFSGDKFQLRLLKYLFRYGCVLERVDLYLPSGVDETDRLIVQIVGKRLEIMSKRLRIYLHDGCNVSDT
ncbi:F-box protein [Cardamine amara subsp. amara]|uniref:F-box protein n=1 Tax=Cardamine amara subsp. amara TaxID=228776 RepID=A0ABD1AN42_CARAN